MFEVLLVDDDPFMRVLVERTLALLTDNQHEVTFETMCSDALHHVNRQTYDLILLDNRLSRTITARTTVPMFKKSRFQSPIAIISNDTGVDYLSHPSILGVDYVVDKNNLIEFLKSQVTLSGLLRMKKAG